MKVLHIQITRSDWKGKNHRGQPYSSLLKVSQGDINGNIECINITKAELMREISDWVDELFERRRT